MMLTKSRWSAALLALTFVAAVGVVRAVESNEEAFYRKPAEVRLGPAAKRRFRDFRRRRPGENYSIEKFYPIGWSRDGKFAYYVEPVDEACNCYFARLDIVDLKTDKVIWSFDYNSEFIDEEMKRQRPYSFDTLWRANRKLFSDKLREHAIEPQGRSRLLFFPAIHRGDRLTADLRMFEKENLTEEDRWYGTIKRITLRLNSRRKGSKEILDHTYTDYMPLYMGALGYLKSPHEPRAAVILIQIDRGYEGPPHVGKVKVVGANLETGFK